MATKHITAPLAVLAALAAAPAGTGQNGPLIGFGVNTTVPSSDIIQQTLCNQPAIQCTGPLPPPSQFFAGGAAYNPMRHSVWHTDGAQLQEVLLGSCTATCSMPAFLALGPQSFASGLTIDAARREMYQVESIAGVAAVVYYRFLLGGPCVQNAAACRVALPSVAHHAGAIAYDGKRDQIWVASSVFNSAAPQNILFVFNRSDPSCQPVCRVALTDCDATNPLQSIRAMAYDECRDLLYLSDGRQTSVQAVVYSPTSPCPGLRPLSCCPLNSPVGEVWAGFDLLPDGGKPVGQSCTRRPCPACPAMRLGTIGAPVVGNASFGFRIDNAPSGATGYLIFNIGPCMAVPLFCGQLYPMLVPPPGVIGAVALPGVGTCGGSGQFPLPVPNDWALCGLPLCAQGLVVCQGTGLGLTNAIEFVLGS